MIPSGPSSPGEWAQRHGHHGRWRCPYIQWDRESPAKPPPPPYPTGELRHQQEVGQTERKWFKDTKSPKSEKIRRVDRNQDRQISQQRQESKTTHQAETELHTSPCSCCFCLSWTLGQDGILRYDFALRNRSESPTNTRKRWTDHTWNRSRMDLYCKSSSSRSWPVEDQEYWLSDKTVLLGVLSGLPRGLTARWRDTTRKHQPAEGAAEPLNWERHSAVPAGEGPAAAHTHTRTQKIKCNWSPATIILIILLQTHLVLLYPGTVTKSHY